MSAFSFPTDLHLADEGTNIGTINTWDTLSFYLDFDFG